MPQSVLQAVLDQLPPPWREALLGFVVTMFAALTGRLMHHARQVQAGRRKFLSPAMLWEFPVALGTGFIGGGLADYYAVTGWQATGLIVTVAYLGPGFVEAVVWRLVDRLAPKPSA